ncbi:Fur family transcriptional regulator [Methylovirgula sp. 4M-Z18]|uniref:Fur family transcriptional regulator n=1 Tax=Methylovirgula sp. 4M-Z18 TaxID=2293567 RepID=UPI000E2E4435|nr:Fur family transcriptional regulator [Methylovirgula sp. 4M-Z18]RFB81265.1 transcriptional repressor [Methylovirgula sp. 4M-Z18]
MAAPHDHDHTHHDRADCSCAGRDLQLTPGRKQVLDILEAADGPLGAYELIDRMSALTGKRVAPVTIYRALDYLTENGLVHRLASRNTFLACNHHHRRHDPVVFLICDMCGSVREATSDAVKQDLSKIAAEAGFTLRSEVIELGGRCAKCT